MDAKVAKIVKNISIFLGIGFASTISLLTFIFTANMPACSADGITISLAPYIIFALLIFFVLISTHPIYDRIRKASWKKVAVGVFIWGLVASVLWVFIADAFPMWDSQDLIAAADVLNHSHLGYAEPAGWEEGGYMERYPYQTPIVLLIVICMKIAGSNFVVFFEFLNCIACALTMCFVVIYAQQLFKNKTATTMSGILVALFAPLIIYATFIYGNLLCLPFAIGCLILQKKAFDDESKKRKIVLVITSIILGAIATLLKKPIIVVVISASILYVIYALSEHKYQYLLPALASIVCAWFAINPINYFVETKVGTNLHNGTPMTTWITMGIGGGDEYFADEIGDESLRDKIIDAGYYNGYPWISPGGHYSQEGFNETNSKYIKKRIDHFIKDPGLFFGFFANKLAISWSEPTFESFLASNWINEKDPTGHYLCNRAYTIFGRLFYYGKAHHVIVFVLDALQTIISVGLLAALLTLRKKLDITQMGAFLAVLGLFVIYLFWETKTQYIFPAYLFMIPFSAMGLVTIAKKIQKLQIIKKVEKLWKRH